MRGRIALILAALVTASLLCPVAAQAGAFPSFTVNLTTDQSDASTANAKCDVDTGTAGDQCTLRAAIQQSNASTSPQSIGFAIGSGHQTIQPTSALPAVTFPVTIDGSTQPGFSGTPLIELNGDNAGDVEGLGITSGPTTVRSLIVTGYDGTGGGGRSGILIEGPSGGNTVAGCDVGFDPSSGLSDPNWWGIKVAGSPDNVIGGTAPGDRNVLSGNAGVGLDIEGAGADRTKVKGNYVGTDATGESQLHNNGSGLQVQNGPSDTVIGGTTAAARNVISGNSPSGSGGILINGNASGTKIEGNFVGTDKDGVTALGNAGPGVWLVNGASNVTIGGTAAGAGNVIGANTVHGINLGGDGFSVSGGGNDVQGNFIGTDRSRTIDLGNGGWGVAVFAQGNLIGGSASGAGNAIAFNDAGGIVVVQDPTYIKHTISRNSIFSNDGLGIDLNSDGVSPNDDDDPDTGANTTLNSPTVDFVTPTPTGANIQATIDTAPNTDIVVEFFASGAADPSGSGEGRRFLGATPGPVNSSVDGQQSFIQEVPGKVSGGEVVTATATDADGNTSEFSVARNVCTKVGTPGDDVLTGTPNRDVLCGMGGRDRLVGMGGADALLGGRGNDKLIGGAGDDMLLGGSGSDLASYENAGSPIGADLRAGSASGEGFDLLGGVEELMGSSKADSLFGTGGANSLVGLAGADRLIGRGGRDGLSGNGGNDLLRGNDGADGLFGGSGDDVLRGGAKNDFLKGQTGNDDMNGGTGRDTCRQGAGTGPVRSCEL